MTLSLSLSLGHYILLVLKFISFISKGLKHSPLEILLQVLDLGIEWSQDLSFVCESHLQACLGYWIFILHGFYSWSVAPRWLKVALKLPLCVVSIGKFVLPIVFIVSSSRFDLYDHLSEERVERELTLCELINNDVEFFVNLNLRIKILCLLCCLCLLALLLLFILLSLACGRSSLLS
jgi:hypothetical protein